MAAPARHESDPLVPLRLVAGRMREHPRTSGLMARLAFLLQPEALNLRMAERLCGTDPRFGGLVRGALDQAFHLFSDEEFRSVPQAIDVLGAERVRRLFTTVAFGWWARTGMARSGLDPSPFVQQAVAAGHVAARLADPESGEDPGAHFALGMALLCGVPLMAAVFGLRYAEALAAIEAEPKSQLEAEGQAFGCDYASAGSVLLEVLQADARLVEAAIRHTQPISGLTGFSLTGAIALQTAQHFGYDAGLGTPPAELPRTWLIRLGIGPAQLASLEDELAREAALASCYFGG